jgi:nitrite reductase/ring-hydroxylating ferredoxin subunit
MQRREFIKNACKTCGIVTLIGALPIALLEGCMTLPMLRVPAIDNKVVIDKLKLAPEKKLFILRSDDLQYDVLLVKNTDNTYYAMYMQCTHNDNPLQANDKGLFCTAHGSTFDFEGKITNGPATQALKKYTVMEDKEHLTININ